MFSSIDMSVWRGNLEPVVTALANHWFGFPVSGGWGYFGQGQNNKKNKGTKIINGQKNHINEKEIEI